ncbi:MAG TPA: hypothetical protein VMF58_16050 [Rhizomicrobium sp.]|nr:hypothetical protein [Rhizomicrobium sp.]
MQNEPQILTRYAVFEGDPMDCDETGLSLPDAFHSIMAHCDYEPVWDTDGDKLRLRFRYMDEPFKDHFVGDIEPGASVETFTAPDTGIAARGHIMRQVVSAGLRGWYAEPMAAFYRDRAMAEGQERARAGRFL